MPLSNACANSDLSQKQRSGEKKRDSFFFKEPASQNFDFQIQITCILTVNFPNHFGKSARIWKANAPVHVRTERFLARQPGFEEYVLSMFSKSKSKSKTFSDHPY
jgi:hypothetical protein